MVPTMVNHGLKPGKKAKREAKRPIYLTERQNNAAADKRLAIGAPWRNSHHTVRRNIRRGDVDRLVSSKEVVSCGGGVKPGQGRIR